MHFAITFLDISHNPRNDYFFLFLNLHLFQWSLSKPKAKAKLVEIFQLRNIFSHVKVEKNPYTLSSYDTLFFHTHSGLRKKPTWESRCWGAMWNLTQPKTITAFTLQIDFSFHRPVMLVNGTPVPPATEPADQNVASSTLTHDSHPAGAFTSSQQWAHLIISADVLRLRAVCV